MWIDAQPPTDLRDYIQSCERGLFYEAVADVMGTACGCPSERSTVKQTWCRLVYGQTYDDDPRWSACCQRWPTVGVTLALIKSSDYRNAARLLQGFESQS